MFVDLFTSISGLTVPGTENTLLTGGYSVVGIGSATYATTANTGATAYRVQSADGRWWELVGRAPLVDQFGAIGDGTADDTIALLAAHAWLALKANISQPPNLQLRPGATYTTTQTLPLPGMTGGWAVTCQSRATILQHTNGTPIHQALCAAAGSCSAFRIEGIIYKYAAPQTASDLESVALAFGATGDTGNGFFDFVLNRLGFSNCWRGVAVDYTSFTTNSYMCPIWGFEMDNFVSDKTCTGATIWLATIRAGSPRGSILNFYAQNQNATEPAVTVKGMSNLYGRCWEFNLGTGSNFYLENYDTQIHGLRFEGTSITAPNGYLCSIGGGQCTIANLFIQNYSVNGTSGTAYVFDCYGSNVYCRNIRFERTATTSEPLMTIPYLRNGGTFEASGTLVLTNEGNVLPWANTDSPIAVMWGPQCALAFMYPSLTASINFVRASTAGAGVCFAYVAPCSGYLTAVLGKLTTHLGSADPTPTLTAGTLQIFTYINGTSVGSGGLRADFQIGNEAARRTVAPFKAGLTPSNAHKVAAGDILQVAVSTSSDFATSAAADLYMSLVLSEILS